MISGLPGKMAVLIEKELSRRTDFEVIPFSLTGSGMPKSYRGRSTIRLIDPVQHEEMLLKITFQPENEGLIAIDFTHPDAVVKNAQLYCKCDIPFVMGTTGGDRAVLPRLVEESEISAVIAPNMSAPIVMFMDMIAYAAKNYPGNLAGWELRIVESHQETKKDVSGTALAIGKVMQGLGVNFTGPENIRSVRDQIEQRLMGIPEFAITGHGWHKYSLLSPDRKVMLGFEHNINGRDTYVDGTLKAVEFLSRKVSEGVKGTCFTMQDVLRG